MKVGRDRRARRDFAIGVRKRKSSDFSAPAQAAFQKRMKVGRDRRARRDFATGMKKQMRNRIIQSHTRTALGVVHEPRESGITIQLQLMVLHIPLIPGLCSQPPLEV